MTNFTFKRRSSNHSPEVVKPVDVERPYLFADANDGGGVRKHDVDILATIEMVEADILSAVKNVDSAVQLASEAAANTAGSLQDIREKSEEVRNSAIHMASDVVAVAAATEELTNNAVEIAGIVQDAESGTNGASLSAREMEQAFTELSKAASEIGSILDVIFGIARQTNLLALNAKIEAARAGPAGRGFAVVANEVGALSKASESSAAEIRTRIELLQSTVSMASSKAQTVIDQIVGVTPLFAAAARAVVEQRESSKELSMQINAAASFAADVTNKMAAIRIAADQAYQLNHEAEQAVATVSNQVSDFGRRFVTVIRQTALADRRRTVRLPVELPVEIFLSGGTIETVTIDLNCGGLLLASHPSWRPIIDISYDLVVSSLPRTAIKVVAISPQGVHCAFDKPSNTFASDMRSLFETHERHARPLINRSQLAAFDIQSIFENALKSEQITECDLFDIEYKLICGSNPAQFTTSALSRLEIWLAPVQEALKASDKDIVFCCAVDRNGYLPVHNLEYSMPQRIGDLVWNTANSRNKRIFDDRAGLTCARSTQPYMIHSYRRDMGGGKIVILKEYVAPITVNGRHWGGFRCAYAIKNKGLT
jgi:methyl-accepting chemotaxis protein